ncbi:hypothetical protein [Paenibacillus naphthalenovorans]|uniref:Uncharacterized protein n=1 Tax=Paenibacillus naphthalenovorans TaxID=162209 RepID=A0A0U2VQY8_9BACL|nr:hypothetical protein [Paenibacillus naphthalenovorans]ALS23174.1 hypothetical protein IJ22_28010 [Paenibacillus naphthalenovorans]
MEKIKNAKFLTEKKNRSLLYHSETIKHYPTLYRFIIENEDITEELIREKLSEEDLKTVEHLMPQIFKNCQDEWKSDDTKPYPLEILTGDNWIRCSICGTKNKEIYYIHNKISGQKLNVGSTCINYFLIDSMLDGKTKGQIKREASRIQRLSVLNQRYPGIGEIISNWNEELHKYEVLIPTSIEEPYLQLGEEVRQQYEDYLNGKEISVDLFEEYLEKQQQFLRDMENYNDAHKGNKFVVTRSIVNWLNRTSQNTVLEKLKETGYVTYSLAPKILEQRFIESLIPEINKHLAPINAVIIGTDEDTKSFIIKPFENLDVKLSLKYEKYLDIFGWKLFGEPQKGAIILYNIFYLSRVADDDSRLIILRELSKKLSSVNMHLRFEGKYDYLGYNEIDIVDRKTDTVMVTKLNEFTEDFKHLAFDLGNKSISEIVNYFNRPEHKKYSTRELRDIRSSSSKSAV